MKQKGFTLLELLVVIGIIAILTSLVTVSYTAAQQSSRDSRRRQDLITLQNAMEQYHTRESKYPGCNDYASCKTALQEYISGDLPKDPLNSGNFVYVFTGDESTYKVTAITEKCMPQVDRCPTIQVTQLQ